MDSHADTAVLGSNCVVLAYTGKECEVSPYADEYDAIRYVHVVTGATVWTNSQDGVPILLVFNEALRMGDRLHHTLINTNQLRSYRVDVQDNPFAKEDLAIITDDYIIPLDTQGTTIFFDTRSPTEVELQQLPGVVLTSAIDWDQQKVQFPSHDSERVVSNTFVQTTSDFCLQKTTYDPEHFSTRIIQQIQVDWPEGEQNPTIRQDIPSASTFQSRERHSGITPADISERWYIRMSQANTPLNATTQRLVRSALLPLSCRYQVDCMYERPHICGTIYTDTIRGQHNTYRFLQMIHSLLYPTQWIRKVVPDKHLNNLLWTSAFQTESYVMVRGNKRGNGRSSLSLRGSMALIYISQNLTDITSLRLKA